MFSNQANTCMNITQIICDNFIVMNKMYHIYIIVREQIFSIKKKSILQKNFDRTIKRKKFAIILKIKKKFERTIKQKKFQNRDFKLVDRTKKNKIKSNFEKQKKSKIKQKALKQKKIINQKSIQFASRFIISKTTTYDNIAHKRTRFTIFSSLVLNESSQFVIFEIEKTTYDDFFLHQNFDKKKFSNSNIFLHEKHSTFVHRTRKIVFMKNKQ